MKTKIKSLMLAIIFMAYTAITGTNTASAYMVGSINVGGVDNFVASTTLGNSGDADELAWVNNVLFGIDSSKYFTLMTKYDVVANNWTNVFESTSIFAQNLQGTPAFFFIKTGNLGTGNNNLPDHFLFQNNANFDWAVIDVVNFGNQFELIGIGKFSHVGELGSTPVPEPGTMVLLGAGLFGLAVWYRRRATR